MYVDGYCDYSWRAMSTNNPKITAVQQICPYCKPKRNVEWPFITDRNTNITSGPLNHVKGFNRESASLEMSLNRERFSYLMKTSQ